jgi:transcriptional regulator with XRE-family HTH domain
MTVEGHEIRARRLRLGMTIEDLAGEAGISADTLGDFESGNRQPRELTVSKVTGALDRIEHEVGMDAPALPAEPGVVTFDVSAEGGFHVVVKGPVANADEIRRQVTEIIREMRGGGTH